MTSIPTTTSFSAFYAHKRAAHNACRLSASTSPVECTACHGTCKTQLRISTVGKAGETVAELPCVYCKDGVVSPVKQLYQKLIWCGCKAKAAANHVLAADGVRVFGKTTYLCGACGFVKQFG
jgi:hypothetical protein